jgi:hypothetical protein
MDLSHFLENFAHTNFYIILSLKENIKIESLIYFTY